MHCEHHTGSLSYTRAVRNVASNVSKEHARVASQRRGERFLFIRSLQTKAAAIQTSPRYLEWIIQRIDEADAIFMTVVSLTWRRRTVGNNKDGNVYMADGGLCRMPHWPPRHTKRRPPMFVYDEAVPYCAMRTITWLEYDIREPP